MTLGNGYRKSNANKVNKFSSPVEIIVFSSNFLKIHLMKSSLFIRSLSNIIFICPYKFENLGCLNLLILFINDLQIFPSKIVSTGVFKILSLHNLADEFKTSDRILSLCYFSTVLKTILISNDFLDHCFEYLYCFALDGVQMFSDVMIISFSFMM